jgi:hypothetical protein
VTSGLAKSPSTQSPKNSYKMAKNTKILVLYKGLHLNFGDTWHFFKFAWICVYLQEVVQKFTFLIPSGISMLKLSYEYSSCGACIQQGAIRKILFLWHSTKALSFPRLINIREFRASPAREKAREEKLIAYGVGFIKSVEVCGA